MLNNVYIWCIPADPIMGTPFSLVTSKMNIYLPLTWIYQIYPLQKELHLCSVVFPRLSSEQRLGHKNCFGTPLSSNSIPIVQQRFFRTSAWKCQPSKSFAQLQDLSRMVKTVELLNSKTFSGISALILSTFHQCKWFLISCYPLFALALIILVTNIGVVFNLRIPESYEFFSSPSLDWGNSCRHWGEEKSDGLVLKIWSKVHQGCVFSVFYNNKYQVSLRSFCLLIYFALFLS